MVCLVNGQTVSPPDCFIITGGADQLSWDIETSSRVNVVLQSVGGGALTAAPTLADLNTAAVLLPSTASVTFTPLQVLPLGLPESPFPTRHVLVAEATVAKSGNYLFSVTLQGGLPIREEVFLRVIEQCSPGSRRVGETGCELCDSGQYSETANAPDCLPCAEYTASPPGATSFLQCVCIPGFWQPVGDDDRTRATPCAACPANGFCSGGVEVPTALPGFFQEAPGAYEFAACPRRDSCAGGNTCREGYEGYLCWKCQSGYYSDSVSRCVKCPPGAVSLFAIFVVALVAFSAVIAGIVAWASIRISRLQRKAEAGSQTEQMHAFRMRMIPASLSMTLVSFQVVGILADADIGWTKASRVILQLFNIFNVDLNLVASECALTSFHIKYTVSVCLPVVTVALTVLFSLLLKALARKVSFFEGLNDLSFRTMVDSVIFSLASLLYIPMARACFVLFDCSELPNGDSVLDVDPGTECYDSSWWGVFPFGLIGITLYVVGIPAYFAFALIRNRHQLFESRVISRYGSLYRLYRRAFYMGEVGNLGKRLLLVVASVFFSSHQLVQLAILFVVLVASSFIVNRLHPFYLPLYNQLDLHFSLVLIVILLIGVASYAERDSTTTDQFFLIATLLAVFALLVVAVRGVVLDLKLMRRERQDAYSAAEDRRIDLANHIFKEMRDVEARPDLRHAYTRFVVLVSNSVHDAQPSHGEQKGLAYTPPPLLEPLDPNVSLAVTLDLIQDDPGVSMPGDPSVGLAERGGATAGVGQLEASLQGAEINPAFAHDSSSSSLEQSATEQVATSLTRHESARALERSAVSPVYLESSSSSCSSTTSSTCSSSCSSPSSSSSSSSSSFPSTS